MEAYYGVPYDFMSAFQGCIAGTEETVLARLQEYVDAEARHLVLRLGTADDALGQLERLADVATLLRARRTPA